MTRNQKVDAARAAFYASTTAALLAWQFHRYGWDGWVNRVWVAAGLFVLAWYIEKFFDAFREPEPTDEQSDTEEDVITTDWGAKLAEELRRRKESGE